MNKTIIRHAWALAVPMLLAVSCKENVSGALDKGQLGVTALCDTEATVKAAVAPGSDMVFSVSVYDGNNGLAAQVADHNDLAGNPFSLPSGTYRIEILNGDPSVDAAFDAPVYFGQTNATVKPDRLTSATVTATLANVMASVSLDETIAEHFVSTSVTVSNASGASLTFSSDEDNYDKTGYFKVDGGLSWSVDFVTPEGIHYYNSASYSDVKAREHYEFAFSVKEVVDGNGKIALRLIVDDSVNVQDYDLTLDFDNRSMPSYATNTEFVLTQQPSFPMGDKTPKQFYFSAPKGAKSLVITVVGAQKSTSYYELVGASESLIAELDALGIKTSAVAYGAQTANVDITDYIASLEIGTYRLILSIYDIKGHMASVDMSFIIMSDVDVDMVSAEPWAKFAVVKAKWYTQEVPEGIGFCYRLAGTSEWTKLAATAIEPDAETKTYSAVIPGLQPSSSYEVKAVTSSQDDTRIFTFATEAAPSLYNLSFDDWYKDGQVWYPYLQGSNPTVWDSANKATASFIGSSTTPEESVVVSGKAARMESKYAMIAFAAGNLYVGKFNKIAGMGADLDWGTPFSGRPVALKGHYNYKSMPIDRTDNAHSSFKGSADKCQIQILLTDWDKPFNINTNSGVFVDFDNDPHIIGYSVLTSDETTNGYREFTLPIHYRNNRIPKYIVVVCASSYMGDYFTGGVGSTLYVDEFSLVYDIDSLTAEEQAIVNFRQ